MGKLNNKIISKIFAIVHNNSHAYIAGYFVLPEYRGKQYGTKIFNVLIEKLSKFKTIKLDCLSNNICYY